MDSSLLKDFIPWLLYDASRIDDCWIFLCWCCGQCWCCWCLPAWCCWWLRCRCTRQLEEYCLIFCGLLFYPASFWYGRGEQLFDNLLSFLSQLDRAPPNWVLTPILYQLFAYQVLLVSKWISMYSPRRSPSSSRRIQAPNYLRSAAHINKTVIKLWNYQPTYYLYSTVRYTDLYIGIGSLDSQCTGLLLSTEYTHLLTRIPFSLLRHNICHNQTTSARYIVSYHHWCLIT